MAVEKGEVTQCTVYEYSNSIQQTRANTFLRASLISQRQSALFIIPLHMQARVAGSMLIKEPRTDLTPANQSPSKEEARRRAFYSTSPRAAAQRERDALVYFCSRGNVGFAKNSWPYPLPYQIYHNAG